MPQQKFTAEISAIIQAALDIMPHISLLELQRQKIEARGLKSFDTDDVKNYAGSLNYAAYKLTDALCKLDRAINSK